MNAFLRKTGLFLGLLPLVLLIVMGLYVQYYNVTLADVPAPNLTDSYSYNEKLLFIKKHPIKAELLAIGSSMSLNNLSSAVVTQKLNSTSFLNAASWGMSPYDDYQLLKILLRTNKPSTLILVSNIVDFQVPEKRADYSIVENYLSNRADNLFLYLNTFRFNYYVTNFKFAKKARSNAGGYENLAYDPYGGVALTNINKRVTNRWNRNIFTRKINLEQYCYLDSIASLCASNHIQLYVFQSPLRWGLYSKATIAEKQLLAQHLQKTRTILNRPMVHVVNSNELPWDDTLFADAVHFNETGAALFTNYCFDKAVQRQQPANAQLVNNYQRSNQRLAQLNSSDRLRNKDL